MNYEEYSARKRQWKLDHSGDFLISAFPSGSGAGIAGFMAQYGKPSDWRKCPFCGRRQNVKEDGAECLRCGGDVMNEDVR